MTEEQVGALFILLGIIGMLSCSFYLWGWLVLVLLSSIVLFLFGLMMAS